MQISGAWSAELPTDRITRELAAAVVEALDRAGLVEAVAAAVTRRLDQGSADPGPGGFAVGSRGDGPAVGQHYDRTE